ncbi:MAG: ISAs1 family transposase [Lachnospiraceae bacterium]|nr:ISAs1 family transposase [Lachnospiraceae bacterium]
MKKINLSELSSCLINWISAERGKRSVMATDGKTMRGNANKQHKAYYVVSVFVAENQITLSEINVEEKTNEIAAVPELLDLINVNGVVVTADAMSCQKKIVEKITSSNVSYTIGLKQNRPALYKDTQDYFHTFFS